MDANEVDRFVAREKELGEIHDILHGNGSRRVAVLHGLGGMGKTQISIEYAKRYRHCYSAVFWVNITSEDSLKQSFVKVARRILREHPSATHLSNIDLSSNMDTVIEAVKSWLSLPNNSRWLVVYDNYDNPKIPGDEDLQAVDIRKYLPEAYQGSVIVTTRSSQVTIGRRIQLSKLEDVTDSLKILTNTSRREIPVNGKNIKRKENRFQLMKLDPNALKLIEELDGFPLALATAGAYLDQVPGASLSDYNRLYKASWLKLQKKTPELSSYEDRKLYSTWQISFEHIQRQNSLSAKLLQLWAYFDNQDLWYELLQIHYSYGPKWLDELVEDELGFNEALGVLCSHGLVDANAKQLEENESSGYSMHGCVHAWTIHVLNTGVDNELAAIAEQCVAGHYAELRKTIPPNEWEQSRRMIRHATRCLHRAVNVMQSDDVGTWAMHNIGLLYLRLNMLVESEMALKHALLQNERMFGPNDPHGIQISESLGSSYFRQGNLDSAEEIYVRVLQVFEKMLQPNDPRIFNAMSNLGVVYSNQGKLDEATELLTQALHGYQRIWSLDQILKDKRALAIFHNLARIFTKHNRLDEAEVLLKQALKGLEMNYDLNQILTDVNALFTLELLGIVLKKEGKFTEAQEWFMRAQPGFEKLYGRDSAEYQGFLRNSDINNA
jgi:tetratricopeptide (TPR) repeat protein